MCGLAGIASGRPIDRQAWLSATLEILRHRGPDGAGEWWDRTSRVGLAHRRLSIIDLSPAANQPMSDTRGELTIVFNGEIYNFRELRQELQAKGHEFRSQSDTEVVLAAYREWGTDCIRRFNGMFAFALCDTRAQAVFLARDRAGEKPLFYRCDNGTLRFASELKALMADPGLPRRVDPESLDCYLSMGFVPGERCILQGVRKLPPAHAMEFSLSSGKARVWRYWRLPDPCVAAHGARVEETALLEELEPLLRDAVRRQLVADVPLGILLSGGVDSSLVTAMAAHAGGRVKTYTVRFPGHRRFDETAHARLVARHFATDHTELDGAEITPDVLPSLARQYDEPIVDSSMVPTSQVCGLVRRHCTVALGGDGGDELFGGYSHYSRLLELARYSAWIPSGIRGVMGWAGGRMLPPGFAGRNWIRALGSDLKNSVPLVASYFDQPSRSRLLPGRAPGCAERVWLQAQGAAADLLDRATRTDFETYLAEDILVKVDRASMLHSLEVRAPLLDHRIIEFAFGKVPARLKATPGARKILLKKLAARVLPPGFDMQRKQGFSIPLDAWLREGSWRSFFEEALLPARDGAFDQKFVGKLMRDQLRGRSNGERLFALVMFELWRREYKVALA